jgi:hypothetical protein
MWCKDRMITIMRDYKHHTCTTGMPSIQDPDLELYYVYKDHISIHNRWEQAPQVKNCPFVAPSLLYSALSLKKPLYSLKSSS